MEEKKSFSEKLGDFFAGKGFYIVLLLCAALIGTSIWLMANGSRADVEPYQSKETGINTASTQTQENTAAGQSVAPAQSQESAEAQERVETMLPVADEEQEEMASLPVEEPAVVAEPAPVQEAVRETMEEIPQVDYFIWPVNGTLLRDYSVEALSYDPTMADWRVHSGWDIAAQQGEQVLSTANGIVKSVYSDERLGTVVEVSHGNGLTSLYANLNAEPLAVAGQRVSVGSVLGTVGSTALSEVGETSHLHFAMKMNGENVDPADWLPEP